MSSLILEPAELDLSKLPEPATIKEVAEFFRIPAREVKSWVEHGFIHYCRVGKEIRIARSAVRIFWNTFSRAGSGFPKSKEAA